MMMFKSDLDMLINSYICVYAHVYIQVRTVEISRLPIPIFLTHHFS